MNRIALAMVEVTNGDLPAATLEFEKGLNVLSGIENRGKTFAFKCFDFVMGASKPPRGNPHSEGYTSATVYFSINNEKRGAVRRVFESRDAECLPYHPMDQDVSSVRWSHLSKSHNAKRESISSYWMSAFGFGETLLRRNQSGAVNALTIRYLAHLVLIDELRIMGEASTARTSQATNWPAEADAFALMLGARRNAPRPPASTPQPDEAPSSAVREFILQELDRLQEQLDSLPKIDGAEDESQHIARRAEEFREAASAATKELQEALIRLGETQRSLTEARAKTKTSRETTVRLELLQQYYQADLKRLGAVSEMTFLVEQLAPIPCPTCLQPFAGKENMAFGERTNEYLSLIAVGAKAEAEKIHRLDRDLAVTLARAKDDYQEAASAEQDLLGSLEELRAAAKTQNDRVAMVRTKLEDTFASLGAFAERRALRQRMEELLRQIPNEHVDGGPALASERTEFDDAAVQGYCDTVQKLLTAWKWNYTAPPLTVTFDQSTTDILISGQTRDSFGKAVRALISSAFVIGLMDYCYNKGLPHPGFVVLDSPLTTKKDSAAPADDGGVTEDILTAFFTHLARNYRDRQIIIIDNKEPPAFLKGEFHHIRFGDDPLADRKGFFPG